MKLSFMESKGGRVPKKTYQELYLEYLESFVAASSEWARVFRYSEVPSEAEKAAYRQTSKAVAKKKTDLILHPQTEVLTIQFSGYDPDHDHYEIDKALRGQFGDLCSPDSETGEFVANCHASIREEVESFLEDQFPSLGFEVIDAQKMAREGDRDSWLYATIPGATNWPAARKTLAELKSVEGAKQEQPHPNEAIEDGDCGPSPR